MRKFFYLVASSMVLVLVVAGCNTLNKSDAGNTTTSVANKELIISAAASLRDSLTEIQKLYEQENSHVKLTMNFASSGTLQKQIEQGAPADLFISAGKAQVDALEKEDLIIKETRVDLLHNELVLITGKDITNLSTIQDLTKPEVGIIAIGTPETVPAGKYAKESLISLNIWESLQGKDKMVMAKDVTQVLTYVANGEAEAGFVYKSDALGETKIRVVAAVPEDTHSPIVYPAAVIAATKNQQETEEFLAFLQGPKAQQIFAAYGFKPVRK